MAKKMAVLSLCFLMLTGCSSNLWLAQFYIFRAESSMDRAVRLKSNRTPFEKRVSYYAQACDFFSKAYERNPEVFTLARIESAADCCWKAAQPAQEEIFRQFQAVYAESHPQESEYGDSGVGMMDMGG